MKNKTIYYLEMTAEQQLKASSPVADFSVLRASIPQPEFSKFLYQFIGKNWQWTDRLSWTDTQWKDYVSNINTHTYTAFFKGSLAGYFEINTSAPKIAELQYFGLSEDCIGKGLGGYFLTRAIALAWKLPYIEKLQLNTCSLDHPHALQNYLNRGFQLYKEEIVPVNEQ